MRKESLISFVSPTKKKIFYTIALAILFVLLLFTPLKLISFVPLIVGDYLALLPLSLYQFVKGPASYPPDALSIVIELLTTLLAS